MRLDLAARRGRVSRLGFSLIELMVVLTLIGLLTAMILPEMKGTYEEALLRSTSRKLVNVLNLAWSQAITVNQLHRVRLDRDTGRYFVERPVREGEGGTGFVPVRDIPGGEGEIDTRISLEIRKAAEEASAAPGPGAPLAAGDEVQNRNRNDALTFYPDGTADAAEILLRDRQGFRLALRINPTTARVRIVELERE